METQKVLPNLADLSSKPLAQAQGVGKKFGIRVGAYIIDLIVFYVANFVTSFAAGILLGVLLLFAHRKLSFDQTTYQWISLFAGQVTFLLYFVIFEWFYGATVGKLMLGMRVVNANGEPCGLGPALVRGLLRYIDGIVFGLVAYASMTAPWYQRLGDKTAKTIVVGSKDPLIQKPRPWWGFVLAIILYLGLHVFVQLLTAMVALR